MSNKLFITRSVKAWRWRIAKAGLTQRSFSKKLGISEGNLSAYLNGRIEPTLAMTNKIENGLKKLKV